jgi:hypothetical protein
MEKKMSPETEVRKGIEVAPEEAKKVDPKEIVGLLADAPPPGEVEGQTFCTSIQCPYCGKSGRCNIDPVPGKYYRCINCGAIFRT